MDEKSTEAEAAETRATAEGDLVATVKALAGAEAPSRKWSAGTSRGHLAFIAKDLLIVASAALFRSGVEQLVFSGTLSLASSRKWSAGTSRGFLAFFAKDLLTIASAAFFRSGAEQLVFSGTLSR